MKRFDGWTAYLVEKWRDEARVFRLRGSEALALAAESYAADLEAEWNAYLLEELTLEDAAAESGYSYSALQKQLASGLLENVGGKGSPRVRRSDLPSKGRRVEPDLATAAILERAGR